ncbi:MAG TPA: SDR family oxidoreductase, partial [Gammaproteobacteria bacterium]
MAAVNSPGQCVVGGSKEVIDELAGALKADGIVSSVLRTSHAFHSHLLEPAVEAFSRELESVRLNKPAIPYISNLSGTWVQPDEVDKAGYWARHLRATVRFADGINTLLAEGEYSFLEVGPERTLSSLLKAIATAGSCNIHVVSSARRASDSRPDDAVFWSALGELWAAGVSPDWPALYESENRRRVPLPAYPFERQKFWLDPVKKAGAVAAEPAVIGSLDDWLYLPSWEPSFAPVAAQAERGKSWLIVSDRSGPGEKIAAELEVLGQQVTRVTPAKRYKKHSDGHYSLRLTQADDYDALFNDCKARGVSLDHVVHCYAISGARREAGTPDIFLETGFSSLLPLLRQAVSRRESGANNLKLMVVADRIHQVFGNEDVQPSKAALLALCRVVGQEFPEINCACIDIETKGDPDMARNIVNEALMQGHGQMVAYRNSRRWQQSFKRVSLPAWNADGSLFKPGGVYLCAGGLGNIALELVERISAAVGDCAFILTSRRELPPPEDWERWLETCTADEAPVADKIRRLLALRDKGVRLLVCRADISDEAAMRTAFSLAQQRFGRIDGVLHAAGDISPQSFAPIDKLNGEQFLVNCRAKVDGLHVLDAILQDVPVDFCVLMSSVSSVLGGLGYTAYSAANIYLDMFVQHKHAKGDKRWLSINWDAWEFDMADDAAMLQMRLVPMTPSEGAEAFIRLTSVRAGPQVLVSKTDFQARLARLNEVKREQNKPTAKTVLHARPSLQTVYAPAATKTQSLLIDLMGGLLGIEGIGVDDSFYDLGGDSLLLGQAANAIRKEFPGAQVNIQDIFENPTVARLAAIIDGKAVSRDDHGAESIPRLPSQDTYEVSPAQLRLWLTYQVDSASSAYHELDVMRVPASWSKQAFENAMNCLIERHEPLRTVFVHHGGVPQQKILPPFKITLEEKFVAAESELQRLINEYRALPFDLTRGPLLRMALVKVSDTGQSLLLWCMHEIIGDGSSLVILFRELSQLMEQNDESMLPTVGIQYKDFAAWQNRLLEGEAGQRSRDYWHGRLQGDIPRVDLPFDFPLTPDSHKGGASYQFALPLAFRRSLESFARSRQATLFMVLQSALSMLFMRLCGQRDITLAVPVSGRLHADVQSMVGFFLNTLLLRHQVEDNDSFLSLLDKVKNDTLQGLAHQYYPFERLLDELQVSRVPNTFPVTPVVLNMLSFTNLDSDSELQSRINFTDEGLKSDIQDYHDTKVELEIYVIGHSDGLRFRVNYRTALFRRQTIEYLMGEFVHLLEQLLRAPEQRLIEHAVFAQSRRVGDCDYPASLNSAWLAFQGPVEQELAWEHVLVAVYQQVRSQPEACAVTGGNISLSYDQLWRRVQTCSLALRSAGLERGAVLGLVTEDGLERLVGLLGGLHAGAIVTPFSCTEPVSRQRRMVEQVEPAGWLVDGSGISRLSELGIGERVPVLNIGNLAVDGADALEPPAFIDGEAASYIFFTSGSSGEPKPILGRAASLAHFIQWEIEEYGLGPGSRISQLAAPTFDASLRDIFTALCSGGTVCLPPAAAGELAPESLLDWLEQAQVSLMHTV